MQLTAEQSDTFRAFTKLLVQTAGDIIARYFQENCAVLTKADATPVTIADREAEAAIRQLIQQHFPEHGILGEEYGLENENAAWRWIIDPVDGTKSFIANSFDFGTIIGLCVEEQPVFGAIYHPLSHELIVGDGQQAWRNDHRIHATDTATIDELILLASDLNPQRFTATPGFAQLQQQVKFSRTWGNCFGYGLIAQGVPAIMYDPQAAIWDSAGIIPIITGAGACITDIHGHNAFDAGNAIASPRHLHRQILAILNGC